MGDVEAADDADVLSRGDSEVEAVFKSERVTVPDMEKNDGEFGIEAEGPRLADEDAVA